MSAWARGSVVGLGRLFSLGLALALPVLCLFFGHRVLLLGRADSRETAAIERLEDALSRIAADRQAIEVESRFLRGIERQVFRAEHPVDAWRLLGPALKRRYGPETERVFLDGAGRAVPGLCDRPVPAYLAGKFVEAYQTCLDDSKPLPPTVQSFMKSFFGPSCVVEREGHGFLNVVSPPPAGRLAFFSRPRPTGTFMLFVPGGRAFQERSLRHRIARFNRTHADVRLTLVRPGERVRTVARRLSLGGARGESFWSALRASSTGVTRQGETMIGRRALFPSLWVVGVTRLGPVSGEHDPPFIRLVVGAAAVLWLTVLFLPFVHPGLVQPFQSVRVKLVLAFFYAVLIPLLIMGQTARRFLADRRQVLEEEAHRQAEKAILAFDHQFSRQWGELMNRVQLHFADLGSNSINTCQDFIERLDLFRARYQFDACRVYDVEGNEIFSWLGPDHPRSFGIEGKMFPRLIRSMATRYHVEAPAHAGDQTDSPPRRADAVAALLSTRLQPFGNIQVHFGRLDFFSTSIPLSTDGERLTHLALLSWSRLRLQQIYLRRRLAVVARNLGLGDFFAWSPGEPGPTFPAPFRHAEVVRPFLGKVLSRTRGWRGRVAEPDRNLLLTGLRGTGLRDYAVFVVTDDHDIRRILDELAWNFRFASLALIGLGLTAVFLLARLFLRPLGDLTDGVAAMRRQEFSRPIPVTAGDELGLLAHRFNDAMSDLQELEVARAVQESLFPGEPLVTPRCEVYGTCRSLSRVGGDYFDYFAIDADRVVMILGDVSGHGVGAALVMAMAKAIIGHPGTTGTPSDMLGCLNAILFPVLKRKKMMSCCLAIFDQRTGLLDLANAGQSFPIMGGREPPVFLEVSGLPLGSSKRWKAIAQGFGPLSDEWVVFYSDGIVEATMAAGGAVGYELFRTALPGLARDSAIAFEQAIRAWHQELTGTVPAEDDSSVLVFKARPGEEQTCGGRAPLAPTAHAPRADQGNDQSKQEGPAR
jgi:hypothetical protein